MRRRSSAPDHFEPEQMARLREWCRAKAPAFVRCLENEVEGCLDYHRAKGNLMADWEAAVRTWIRRSAERMRQQPGPPQYTLFHGSRQEQVAAADGATVSKAIQELREKQGWRH